MEARNSSFIDFMGGPKQFSIPIFQRPYSWEKTDVIKMLEDVMAIANNDDRPCHFIGSVIYLSTNNFASQISEYSIIDGQQRLTTLSLMLLALSDYSRTYFTHSDYIEAETRYEQIKDLYLINRYGRGDLKYKLKLCGDDFVAYKKLFEIEQWKESGSVGEEITMPDSLRVNRVYKNYQLIYSFFSENSIDPCQIMKGIRKLLIVDIPLKPEDDAQLVFETVNSTGKPLTEAQKIKNYILMTVSSEEQLSLYNESWLPIESGLSASEFDEFFRYYMIVKLKKRVSSAYYNAFKDFARKSDKDTIAIVNELKSYYDHYSRWKQAEESSNNSLDKLIAGIKKTGQNKVTPVVLQVLEDIKKEVCSIEQAQEVLSVIEAYWMRRAICDLPSNTAGVVCFIMLRNIGRADYVENFKSAICDLTYAQRIPKDDEIKNKLYEVPIYKKWFARMLLDKMEAHENREYTHSSNHSIEHIMPQTIQSHDELYLRSDLSGPEKEKLDWASDLGENWQQTHERYKDTIGNLTLTGFNSEYQNYRFRIKKEMENGYNQSPIRLTSRTLAQRDRWGEVEIKERSDKMAEIICDIWKYPNSLKNDPKGEI